MRRFISLYATALIAAVVALIFSPLVASAANTSPFANYVCDKTQVVLFDNSNGGLVGNGGTPPTLSTNGKAYCLNGIETYHWNNGKGSKPGYLWLKRLSGPAGLPDRTSFFQALGSPGQNNVANANSYVYTPMKPPIIIDGTYQCVDTIRGTWSQDAASGGNGFCHITVMAAMPASAAGAKPAAAPVASSAPTKSATTPSNNSSSKSVVIGIAAVVVVGIGVALFLMKGGLATRSVPKPPTPTPSNTENTIYEGTGGALSHDEYVGTDAQKMEQAVFRMSGGVKGAGQLSQVTGGAPLTNQQFVVDEHLTDTASPTDSLPDLSGPSEMGDGEVM